MHYVINYNTRQVVFMHETVSICQDFINTYFPGEHDVVLCKEIELK